MRTDVAVLIRSPIRERGRKATRVALVGAAFLLPLAGSPSPAQSRSTQNVRVVEPRFTRILGSDSMLIDGGNAESVIDDRSVAVSPDGRWIAWEGSPVEGGSSQIWVSSITGGEPVRVSSSGHDFNANPVWFPDSRRLAFRSGTPSFGPFIYSVELDPQTGRPVSEPRQVSIEGPRQYGFGVSPDGSQIVYIAHTEDGRRALRVVPARGGTTRTVWEAEDYLGWPVWSPDGQSIYVLHVTANGGGTWTNGAIRRVPADGGTGEIVAEWEEGLPYALSPDGRYVTRRLVSASGAPVWELATIEGRDLARFELPENTAPAGFWPGELSLMAVAHETAAPLQVMPVSGGPARQLTERRAYDLPLRWMPDGRQVFMSTQLNGETLYMLMDVETGGTHQIQFPEPMWRGRSPAISDDGRYVGWVTGRFDENSPAVKLLDVEEGSVQVVTGSPCRLNHLWPMWDRGRLLFCEEQGDRQEYRALTPEGASEVLLSYPADAEDLPGIGVRGDWVAFTENDGETGSLLLTSPGEEPRRLVTLPGAIGSPGMQFPVFAPDGRAIVVGYARPGAEDVEAVVVRLTADGSVDGEPMILELEGGPLWWWDPQWLPDGSGLVIFGMGGATTLDNGIWLVRLDPSAEPVDLTADDPDHLSGFFCLSRDGRQIVYSSERPGGSSIWKVELGDPIRH